MDKRWYKIVWNNIKDIVNHDIKDNIKENTKDNS